MEGGLWYHYAMEASLVTKQQGYYNYLNGLMLSQTNMNEAEKYFKKAVTSTPTPSGRSDHPITARGATKW